MKQQTKTVPKMKKAPKNLTQMSFSQDQQQKLQNPNCTLIQKQESHFKKCAITEGHAPYKVRISNKSLCET